ncbi:MAG: type II secretion system protein [Phycisphaerae bacterium]|nr:type II secretion system protein [Phycisphaerae bacterium]
MKPRKIITVAVPAESRRGFTLIELLVVIAIISLLVSILLPSLTKAKQLARQVVCSGNLRNIGVAFQMYQSEWDGDYPACIIWEPHPSGKSPYSYYRWTHQLIPYLTDIDWSDNDIANYGMNPKYFCPEDIATYSMNAYKAGGTTFYGWTSKPYETLGHSPYSYHFNTSDLQSLGDWTENPNYWVLLFESNHANRTFNSWVTGHESGSNVIMAEGAVEFWPIELTKEMEQTFHNDLSGARTYWLDDPDMDDYYWRFRGPGMYLK